MKRQRLSAVISLLAHLVTGLGPGAALGAVATWYAWGEQQRLKRMERYGIQTIAAIRLSRTDRTGASSELVSLVWRDSSGPRRLDNFEISGRLATALRRAGQSQQHMRITFLPGAIRTHPVPTDDLPELQADALRATQVLATATLLCCALMWWMHVPRRIRRHARLQRGRATVDTATPTDPTGRAAGTSHSGHGSGAMTLRQPHPDSAERRPPSSRLTS